MSTRITIIGSGAMATACSILLSEHAGQKVAMLARNSERAGALSEARENRRLLPGIRIPQDVLISADIDEAVDGADFLVAAIPTKYLRVALQMLAPKLAAGRPVISVIKGIEIETFLRPSQVICETLGDRPVVALSGPSHAEEIARRLPASVVAASVDLALARTVQKLFNTDRFRVYTNQDIIGVEMAAALKNVIAIAAGISDGLGYGDNAKSSLMTRGLVEMSRFGAAMGADADTFSGLAGIGDLIATCISRHSRNRAVGERLGRGETLEQILASMEAVAEGINTTESVHGLALEKRIGMPITAEVYRVLFGRKSPEEATNSLMERPLKSE